MASTTFSTNATTEVRGGPPDSATSQWFINLTDNPNPDRSDGAFVPILLDPQCTGSQAPGAPTIPCTPGVGRDVYLVDLVQQVFFNPPIPMTCDQVAESEASWVARRAGTTTQILAEDVEIIAIREPRSSSRRAWRGFSSWRGFAGWVRESGAARASGRARSARAPDWHRPPAGPPAGPGARPAERLPASPGRGAAACADPSHRSRNLVPDRGGRGLPLLNCRAGRHKS
jgi:hypothetical protein